MTVKDGPYVSRGGEKLAFALDHFELDVAGLVCADLGSHVGGFVDVLLQRGAARVHSVDTSYGTLAWKLRRDPRVVVHERTNAMHLTLPEPVALVTIDVGWTAQDKILPNAVNLLEPDGHVVTLIKPHYEAQSRPGAAHREQREDSLADGVLPDSAFDGVVLDTLARIESLGWRVLSRVESPLRGHAGNRELLALLVRATD